MPRKNDIVVREDGSWLVDGSVTIERLKAVLGIRGELPGEDENAFNTLGGFVMYVLGRIPLPSDHFDCRRPAFRGGRYGPEPGRQGTRSRAPGCRPTACQRLRSAAVPLHPLPCARQYW
jgi:hypothetical protein